MNNEISKRFIISSIIPNSPIIKDFFNTLKLYAKLEDAEIILYHTKLNSKDTLLDVESYGEYLRNGDLKITGYYKHFREINGELDQVVHFTNISAYK